MRDTEVRKACDLIRSVIDPIAQPMLDQVCIEVAGKSSEEAEAELRRVGEELSRLMKQTPHISDAVAFSMPRVFIEMARERLAMMPDGGRPAKIILDCFRALQLDQCSLAKNS